MRLTDPLIVAVAGLCAALQFARAAPCAAEATPTAVYRTPDSAELHQAEQLFSWLFAGESLASARSSAEQLGFSWQETDDEISLLDVHKRGWGDYRFSKVAGGDTVLQAPHRFHDRHTADIANRLFDLQGLRSIALNSLSRRTPMDNGGAGGADLARLPDSFHIVYSRAFAARYPRGKLLQLHGFSRAKRNSLEAQQSQVILSTGSNWASAYLLDIQRCFNDRGWQALRYPQQVRELGATRNSVGAMLRNLGHGGFTHIELDLDTRRQLSTDPGRLEAFAGCLLEPDL